MAKVEKLTEIERVLATAAAEVGRMEEPPGSNRTKYGKAYGWDGVAWCVIFLWWCFYMAGLSERFYGGGKCASCSKLSAWAREHNQYINRDYRPGDLVFMNFSGGKAPVHIGIVEWVEDGKIHTIEGNTSLAGCQDNGGTVMRKTRPATVIVGGVRPNYERTDESMTGEEIYLKLKEYLMSMPAPDWAQAELSEAKALGITDGTAPCLPATRYQAAIMAKRAAQAGGR